MGVPGTCFPAWASKASLSSLLLPFFHSLFPHPFYLPPFPPSMTGWVKGPSSVG